jgi:ABC-type transport system substrate-binding protein
LSLREARAAHVAAFVLLFMAALPARGPAALGPRYGGEMRVAVSDLPPSLDPASPVGAGRQLAAGLVHETLVGIGPDGQLTPGLAAASGSTAEGREQTLILDDEARFHDGRPATADDAVRSLRAFLRGPGAAAGRLAHDLEGGLAFRSRERDDLPGLMALDPHRLVLRLVSASPASLAPLASPAAAITSPAGAGAGPFVPALFVPGQRLVVTAFPGHVRGRPYLDRVLVTVLPDPASRAAEARAGRVDLAAGEPDVSALAASLLLVLDPRHGPFDRPEARAAVSGAIDRTLLMGRLVPGGRPSTDLLPPLVWPPAAAPPSPGEPPPVRAALLSGAVTLSVSRDVPPAASQRVVAHLTALGLGVRAVAVSPADALEAATELRLLAFSPTVPEPALALEELLALAPPSSSVAVRLDAAQLEVDPARRLAGLAQAEDALRREGAIVPIGQMPVRFGGSPTAHGARVDATGRLILEDAWVEP